MSLKGPDCGSDLGGRRFSRFWRFSWVRTRRFLLMLILDNTCIRLKAQKRHWRNAFNFFSLLLFNPTQTRRASQLLDTYCPPVPLSECRNRTGQISSRLHSTLDATWCSTVCVCVCVSFLKRKWGSWKSKSDSLCHSFMGPDCVFCNVSAQQETCERERFPLLAVSLWGEHAAQICPPISHSPQGFNYGLPSPLISTSGPLILNARHTHTFKIQWSIVTNTRCSFSYVPRRV